MSKYSAIIFDLDGVICHTDKYHYKAWKAVADNLGIYFDETINHRLRGVSRMESFEIILERHPQPMAEVEKITWANKKNDIYVKLLENLKPEDVDVTPTLDALKNLGLKLAIGSSSKNARFILKQIGLLDATFDTIVDGNNIANSKPHPEVFLAAAAQLGIPPAQCLVVEDAESGVDAALAAGMHCAAIGDATRCGKGHYQLTSLEGILKIVM